MVLAGDRSVMGAAGPWPTIRREAGKDMRGGVTRGGMIPVGWRFGG